MGNANSNIIRNNIRNNRNNIRDNRCNKSIHSNQRSAHSNNEELLGTFNDLSEFPPEVALSILSNLNATDLCLASCVWQDLAEDEVLWKSLCYSRWAYTSIYDKMKLPPNEGSRFAQKPVYKSLYLLLDEASLIYSFRPHQGVKYLIDNHVLLDEPVELAKLIQGTSAFYGRSTQILLKDRRDVLDEFVQLQQFSGVSLCDSLRQYFSKIHPPEQRGDFLEVLVEKFSQRFHECNLQSGFNRDDIAVLCYSLLLLSVDLYSPQVKNKMSKREFIRNNRQIMTHVSTDVLSDIYDDVYLNGHVVPTSHKEGTGAQGQTHAQRFPFYRPYGAIFDFKPMHMKLNCAC